MTSCCKHWNAPLAGCETFWSRSNRVVRKEERPNRCSSYFWICGMACVFCNPEPSKTLLPQTCVRVKHILWRGVEIILGSPSLETQELNRPSTDHKESVPQLDSMFPWLRGSFFLATTTHLFKEVRYQRLGWFFRSMDLECPGAVVAPDVTWKVKSPGFCVICSAPRSHERFAMRRIVGSYCKNTPLCFHHCRDDPNWLRICQLYLFNPVSSWNQCPKCLLVDVDRCYLHQCFNISEGSNTHKHVNT